VPTPTPTPTPTAPAVVINAEYLTGWQAAREAVKTGRRAKIAIVSDSTSAGQGVGRNLAWPAVLAETLDPKVPAHAGSFFGDGAFGIRLPASDPRLELGDGWTQDPTIFTIGGFPLANTTTTSWLIFRPGTPGDRVDIYDAAETFTAPMEVELQGGGGVIPPPSASTIRKTSFSFTRAAFPGIAIFAQANGGVFSGSRIIGVDVYDSTRADVAVWNMGISGATTALWLSQGKANPLSMLATLDPDLTVICLGINDLGQNVTPAVYKANIRAIALSAKASGDVVLMVPNRISHPEDRQQAYEAVLIELSNELHVPLVNLPSLLGRDIGKAVAAGNMLDDLHPSLAAHRLIGPTVGELLLR
jgi:lysophospholipase L1-like esterase